jgi:hypothetical protein
LIDQIRMQSNNPVTPDSSTCKFGLPVGDGPAILYSPNGKVISFPTDWLTTNVKVASDEATEPNGGAESRT